jgi:hypothetical protein
MRRWITPLLLVATAACDDTVGGQRPVLSDVPEPAEMERFARRLHLDLSGKTASDDYVDASVDALTAAANSVASRSELADELMESQDFADAFVAELDNRVFAGDDVQYRYEIACGGIRDSDPACQSCPPPAPGASGCSGCSCPALVEVETDRLALAAAGTDFGSGATTAEIERRFASSRAISAINGPEGIAQTLFESFLGRVPESEELRNARMMIIGFVLAPDAPAGLLFQRHGSDLADLVEIIFESDVYREAAVNGVFRRYLGRDASPLELAHFSGELDPADPDVRSVIRAVTSSREYFAQ